MVIKRTRAGGRAGNQRRSIKTTIDQMSWRQVINTDRPTEPLDEEGIQNIHEGVIKILEDIGIEFMNPEALKILKKGGATVNGENVKIGRDLLAEMLSHTPREFSITPRNPERKIRLGGKNMAFVNVSSPPNMWDLERGKRPGDFEGFKDFLKLTQYFNCIHVAGGYPVEPVDIHASVRHLDCLYEKLILTDKVVHAYSLGKERVEDVMEMVRIAGGLTHEEFEEHPRMYTNINSVSPLKHDFPMLDGTIRLARRGQPIVVTPFTLAGAMAPVTMSGAVTLSLAEGLAAIVMIQMIRKGCPTMIGTFTSNVDMKSGAPAFGTPEYMRATQMTGQMARFYGLPMRSSGVCTANVPDGQAMWETSNSLWAAVQSGTNLVYHAAGWLEGGLVVGYEKFILDADRLGMLHRMFEGLTIDDNSLATSAYLENSPGENFLGTQHTAENFETANYRAELPDNNSFEQWTEDGSKDAEQRAYERWNKMLEEYIEPPMDQAIDEELLDFMCKKKEGMADEWY